MVTTKRGARVTIDADSSGLRGHVTRTALLAVVALLSLASLRLALAPAPAPAAETGGDLHLSILLAALKDHGHVRRGGRAVFLGDAGPWLQFLERNRVAPVSAAQLQALPVGSVDLVLVLGHGHSDGVAFGVVDSVLKVGGEAAFFAASKTTAPRLPDNLKTVLEHRSDDGAAVSFAAEKTGGEPAVGRKLLAVQANKADVLAGLEGVLLEPPEKRHAVRRLRPKFLPELTGDSLEGYRRRVFVDVTPSAAGGGAASWFKKHYPRGRHEFEIVRLTAAEPASAGPQQQGAAGGVGEWLEGNVSEEDYVVVKAGVEAAEEMLRKGGAVVRRVDELFLDCGEEADSGRRRPYWQCLALYGRFHDQRVAMHQWWNGMLKIK